MNLIEALRSSLLDDSNVAPSTFLDLKPMVAEMIDAWHAQFQGSDALQPLLQVSLLTTRWLIGSRLERLTRRLTDQVTQIWPNLSQVDIHRYVRLIARRVIAEQLNWDWTKDWTSSADAAAVPAARRPVLITLGSNETLLEDDHVIESRATISTLRYAEELGFLHQGVATSAGSVFLALRGREAVRWVIATELAATTGDLDPWRCDRTTLLDVTVGSSTWEYEVRGDRLFDTMARLASLGLLKLSLTNQDGYSRCDVTPLGEEIRDEVARDSLLPLYSLAAALAAENASAAIASIQPASERAARETVDDAVSRFVSHITHELRNKLPPIQTAVAVLRAARPQGNSVPEALDLAEDAVTELFRFTSSILDVATGLRAPHEPFSLGQALRDAVDQGRNGDRAAVITVTPATDEVTVRGPRAQVVLAIGNLVRNALQAATGPARVDIGIEVSPEALEIHVDDAGPGVPADLRERIFAPGFSNRRGGSGTGIGLNLVRDVFEREMGGRVTCLDSPLGGARFRIVLGAAHLDSGSKIRRS